MKFKVSTAGYFYPNKQDRDRLSKIGFTFPESEGEFMKKEDSVEVEIKDLEELILFSKQHSRIIIEDGEIKIYDDYLE